MLWKQTTAGGDPLDYRFTYEPFVPDPAAATGFAARLAEHPAIVRAGAWIEKLWKGDRLLEETVQLVVDAPAQADVLTVALDAARESILSGRRSYSASVGRPGEGMPILYEVSG